MSNALTLPSPAKINRFLHVVGQREDGYHELQTIFHLIDYADILTFRVRQDSQINIINQNLKISKTQNLVYRAAKLLQQSNPKRLGIDISLEKKIPVGGGLGGGSSNAATTLLALNKLWNLNFSLLQLAKLGEQLGADAPVFIYGKSAWGEGIGEKLTPIDLPKVWFLVIVPPFQVETIEIFCDKQLTRDTPICTISTSLLESGHNDCEAVAKRLYPEIADIINWLNNFAKARITGTGASVFATFPSKEQAEAIAVQVPSKWKHFIAEGLSESPVHGLIANL